VPAPPPPARPGTKGTLETIAMLLVAGAPYAQPVADVLTAAYGFLSQIVDSRVIRATGGNTNLGIKDPTIDHMLDQALLTTDTAAREQIWVGIDRKVMEDAFVLPGI
jgi:hypothetical protein